MGPTEYTRAARERDQRRLALLQRRRKDVWGPDGGDYVALLSTIHKREVAHEAWLALPKDPDPFK